MAVRGTRYFRPSRCSSEHWRAEDEEGRKPLVGEKNGEHVAVVVVLSHKSDIVSNSELAIAASVPHNDSNMIKLAATESPGLL